MTICKYSRGSRLQSVKNLRVLAEPRRCTHIALAVGRRKCQVEILVNIDSRCYKCDGDFPSDCGKEPDNQVWVICHHVPSLKGGRSLVDPHIVSCTLETLAPDLLSFLPNTVSGNVKRIDLAQMTVLPLFKDAKLDTECYGVDDRFVRFEMNSDYHNFMFGKISLSAKIHRGRDGESIPVDSQHAIVEVTIPPKRRDMITKTVLELDLAGYSSKARMLESNIGPQAVAVLNQQIQNFVDHGLADIRLSRSDSVLTTTGDGAILAFSEPNHAHLFAKSVHAATRAHNLSVSDTSAQRRFRMGAATGEIVIQSRPDGDRSFAGIVISDAVRLEAAAQVGQLLIDATTYNGLDNAYKIEYGSGEQVHGKREELFLAYRSTMDPDAPPAIPESPGLRSLTAKGDRREILLLLESLYPEEQLEKLIFLIEMPARQQPSKRENHEKRTADVLNWAASPGGCGLGRLESELRYLTSQQLW